MIVISPNEIKLKHNNIRYELKSMPFLGFSFDYLYYEPEVDLFRKVIKNSNNDLVYVDLTENEIDLIKNFLATLNDATILTDFLTDNLKQPEYFDATIPNNISAETVTYVHTVNAAGVYQGQQALNENLIQVPAAPPRDVYLDAFGLSYYWDFNVNDWKLNGGYKEQRKLEYLKTLSIGDQLGALFSAVDALAKGNPLPADFISILSDIQSIKNSIKKE